MCVFANIQVVTWNVPENGGSLQFPKTARIKYKLEFDGWGVVPSNSKTPIPTGLRIVDILIHVAQKYGLDIYGINLREVVLLGQCNNESVLPND